MQVLEHMSLYLLRDFMLPSMEPTIDHLKLIPYILQSADSSLGQLLSQVEPFYAISSVLTLFSHDIESLNNICIIFDYVLASGSMIVPLYLYASMVISRKDELDALETNDCDILHSALSSFPSPISAVSLFDVTARASVLLELHPPQMLENWGMISNYSVLKTTAAPQPPGRRYSSVYDQHLERMKRRKSSARSRLASTGSIDFESPASESESQEPMLDSMSTTYSMSDSKLTMSESVYSPFNSVQGSSFITCVSVSDTEDDGEIKEEKDLKGGFNPRIPRFFKRPMYSVDDTLKLLEHQIEESNRKAEEERIRRQQAAEQRKIEFEQRRQEIAAKRAAAAVEEKAYSSSSRKGKFTSATTAFGLISSMRVAEVFPTITKGSGALVHHLTRNLRTGSRALTPTTMVGVSIYFGLFSILAYAWYYNQAYFHNGGLLRWIDFRIVWEKMVARYFQ